MQALFDANPEYSLAVNGRRPHANEAQLEFDEMPPLDFTFTRRWFVGLFDPLHEMVGIAVVVDGNGRAERFWARNGFSQVRTRPVDTGGRMNTVRVMVKALRGGALDATWHASRATGPRPPRIDPRHAACHPGHASRRRMPGHEPA